MAALGGWSSSVSACTGFACFYAICGTLLDVHALDLWLPRNMSYQIAKCHAHVTRSTVVVCLQVLVVDRAHHPASAAGSVRVSPVIHGG